MKKLILAFLIFGCNRAVAQVSAPMQAGPNFVPAVSSSTVSPALSGTYTNTALGPCVATSTGTLTLPTNSSRILVIVNLTASDGNLNAILGAGVLLDGAFVNGETAAKGLIAPAEDVATDGTNLSFNTLLSGLSAASHNVCLTLYASAGTGTIDSTNSVANITMVALP